MAMLGYGVGVSLYACGWQLGNPYLKKKKKKKKNFATLPGQQIATGLSSVI
jgi:hypothetical protein